MPINFSTILNADTREQIGQFLDENLAKGVAPNVRQVRKLLEEQFPLGYVVYSDGSKHSLTDYSDMLVRTTLLDAQREATIEFIKNNPTDLVQVSFEGSDHPGCALWEGQIFSITGLHPDFPPLDDALGPGQLFHPRCVHSIFPIYNDGLESTRQLRENNLREIIQSTIFTSRFAKDATAVIALWEAQKRTLSSRYNVEYTVEAIGKKRASITATITVNRTGESITLESVIDLNRPVGSDEPSYASLIKKLRNEI